MLTEPLQLKANEVLTDLINANAAAIAEELQANPEGKLTVSLSAKLTLVSSKLYVQGCLGFSRKFTDETEAVAEIADPNQPELPVRGGAEE